jgi:methionyl-tRNA formyltransferase
MGTPEFAVPSLDILLQNGYDVAAVVTAPDKPGGRGMQLQESAVKKFAASHGLKILQPLKLKDEVFLHELEALQPDLQVVVAFRMLPERVWMLPRIGTINLHGSLLPEYRGAAPINRAIMNGEELTGVTTFFLQHEIDTGKIIFQEKMPIGEKETAGELHDRMKITGAQLVLKTVQAIAEGNYPQQSQEESADLKKAPKIFSVDTKLDWTQSTDQLFNQVRGLSPYPGAFTTYHGKVLKIFTAEKIKQSHSLAPGDIKTDGKTYLWFATNDGFIDVKTLQMEGKKKMSAEEFLRGHKIEDVH